MIFHKLKSFGIFGRMKRIIKVKYTKKILTWIWALRIFYPISYLQSNIDFSEWFRWKLERFYKVMRETKSCNFVKSGSTVDILLNYWSGFLNFIASCAIIDRCGVVLVKLCLGKRFHSHFISSNRVEMYVKPNEWTASYCWGFEKSWLNMICSASKREPPNGKPPFQFLASKDWQNIVNSSTFHLVPPQKTNTE